MQPARREQVCPSPDWQPRFQFENCERQLSRPLTSITQIANAGPLHQLFDNQKRLSPYSTRFCHVSPYYSKILREFCAKPMIRKDRGGRGCPVLSSKLCPNLGITRHDCSSMTQ